MAHGCLLLRQGKVDDAEALADQVTARQPWQHVGRLTPRERETHQLSLGDSDQEIAAAQHLSRKTVSNHVSAVLGRLGVTTRTAAALIGAKTTS